MEKIDAGSRRDPAAEEREPRVSLDLTQNANEVLRARYLKKNERGEVVETPEELFRRVARAIASAEAHYGLSTAGQEEVEEQFYDLLAAGKFMPNSPTLMNAGRRLGMLSACFVLPVEDSIDGIFGSVRHAALIQKAGGGTGFSFSRLRPTGDLVRSSGGTTSGPLSFLGVFSRATDAIQQGAFRRGANMGVMRIDHPDILAFIRAKDDKTALTNFNLSVSITDGFMDGLLKEPDGAHAVVNPRNGEQKTLAKEDGAPWTRREIFDLIIDRAWKSGEPGVIFIDRMNRDNPTPAVGEIEATNPCGEQPLLPYESCNLGSINVAGFVRREAGGAAVDYEALRGTVKLGVRFLDNVIDVNRYPLAEIEKISRGNRKIGLGIMGFADALFALGIPYNSDAAIRFAEELMEFVNEESHAASEALAAQRGVFPNFPGSVWEQRGRPMRNAATTTIAPTGTISIIADCSGGIEPLFSVAFWRQVLDGKRLPEVNRQFMAAATERGFLRAGLVEELAEKGSLKGVEGIPEDVRRVFVTAHDISPEWHVRMQAAFQRHCDASISKTINFPREASRDDVRRLYLLAYQERVKGITVYRDGSREHQPMTLTKKGQKPEDKDALPDRLKPVRLPEIMSSLRVRQITPFGNMHVKITVEPRSGRERELFAQLGRGGDVANSDLEAVCRLTSLFLRCNGRIEDIVEQLDGIGSSLSVPSRAGRIMSLADGLAKAIQKYLFLKKKFGLEKLLLGQFDMGPLEESLKEQKKAGHDNGATAFRVKCPECNNVLDFAEGCVVCHGCGFSQC
ncbi:MAG TPA: ribonucleotide-diphosphate reductase subunit alpha [Planctomycetes bacterium]|nr:ribonucleotide-diphosphate reductase subunit alpha [Planctomycetota bacterium]